MKSKAQKSESKVKEGKMNRRINIIVVIYSIIGLCFLALGFLVNWMFIIGAVIIVWLNQRELSKNRYGKRDKA